MSETVLYSQPLSGCVSLIDSRPAGAWREKVNKCAVYHTNQGQPVFVGSGIEE